MTRLTKNSAKKIENRPVALTLKNMQVNDTEQFSVRQMDSVRNAINRIQIYGRIEEEQKKFTTKTEGNIFIVTRTA